MRQIRVRIFVWEWNWRIRTVQRDKKKKTWVWETIKETNLNIDFCFHKFLYINKLKRKYAQYNVFLLIVKISRSSPPQIFFRKGVQKKRSKFTGDDPFRSVIFANYFREFEEIKFFTGIYFDNPGENKILSKGFWNFFGVCWNETKYFFMTISFYFC